jgi:GntR family transcriptional regulator, transcriptional repressor for pyruvate dehydrogenase complex
MKAKAPELATRIPPAGGKPLARVLRTSLVDEVIAAMRRMLGEDAWPPGAKLPSEQQLARELGVGRSTVREALRVLEHLGMVESRSGLGTYVIERGMPEGRLVYPQTPETFQELYECRRALEVPGARLAAERRTAAQLAAIKEAWARCRIAVENDSANEFAELDYVFHLSVIEAAQNRFYVDAYKTLENAFARCVNEILALGPLRSMLHFHDDLIDAIGRGDADAAVKAAEENFMETDVRLRLLLQNTGSSNEP